MSTEQINYFISILPNIKSFAIFAFVVLMPLLIVVSFILALFMPQILLNLEEEKFSSSGFYLRFALFNKSIDLKYIKLYNLKS